MLSRRRRLWSAALTVLLGGCVPPLEEVQDTESSGDPPTSSSGGSTSDPPGVTTEGSATVGSAEGTGSEGTTMALDGGSTTDGPASTSGSVGTGSSSGDDEDEDDDEDDRGSTTTGEPADCHPILAEVLYDAMGDNDLMQWVRLYNPCDTDIELDAYVLAWGGTDYTYGQHALAGSLAPGDCWVVGGPNASNDNANPMWDQNEDFDPDLQASGGLADGVALFLGAGDVMADTVPLDAVIYGGNNDSGLLDATGDTPAPHVGDVGQNQSIRRTALDAEWEEAQSPTPNECPAL